MTVGRWPLLAACLASLAAGCNPPGHATRSPAAAAVVSLPARGNEAFRPRQATPTAGPAHAGVAPSASDLQRARTRHRLGLDLRQQGRLVEARGALEEARDLFSKHGCTAEQAETLNDLGEVLFQLGDLADLEQTEWQALKLAESAGLAAVAATAWNNLGVAFAARGLPSAALEAYGRCRDLRRGLGNLAGEAAALHNRGVQLLVLGRLREGSEELRQAVALHRTSGTTVELGQSLASLAWGLAIDGQPDAALAAYGEALSVLSALRADYDLAVALEQRAQLYRRLGRLREAREDLERSLLLAEKKGGASRFHIAYLHLGFGAVLRDQGQIARAVTLLRQSVREFDLLGGQEGRVMARLELAKALRAGGARTAAIAVLEAALTVVESARASLHQASLRGSYLGEWQDAYRELVDQLAEAAVEAPSRHEHQLWAIRAFAVSERARARALLDLLEAPSAAGGRPAQADEVRLGPLRRRVEQLEAAVLAEPAGQHLAALRRLRVELELLQETAANAAGARPRIAQPAPLAAILRQLGGKTTLLAYSLGARRSWLWRIDARGVEVLPLTAGPRIEAAARNAHRLFPLSEQIGFRKAAHYARQYLSQLVLGPLARSPLAARIAVIPDGALHLVPFAALDRSAGEDGTVRALGEDHEVVHLPSASALVELRQRRDSRHPASNLMAIMADPVFEANDPRFGSWRAARGEPTADPSRALARTRQALGGRFGRLLGSAEEARRIAAIAGRIPGRPAAPVVSGFDATRELVTGGSLDGFRLLHFASHALVDADDPALAGLLLSLYRADGRPQDGLLRARDLYGLRLSAELVVLSACQTALGQQVRGEGVVGLADGFFAAGANQLIVSLWEVDDRATAELMSRFYNHLLLHGRRAADALRRAQHELRDETRWASPAYWGAFIALGDWEAGAGLGHRSPAQVARASF